MRRGGNLCQVLLSLFVLVTGSVCAGPYDRLEALPSEERRLKVREYILLSYRPLSLDVLAGRGEYLDSLCSLLEDNCRDNAVLGRIRELLFSEKTVASFAISLSKESGNLGLPN